MSALEPHLDGIVSICRRYGVDRLEVIGSAATAPSLAECRDVDLLVTFREPEQIDLFDAYFPRRDDLSTLFGKSVDLIEPGAIRDPGFRQVVERSRKVMYAA